MSLDRLRRRIAFEAAKLIFTHQESQYGQARTKAVRRIVAGEVKSSDLPGNREIRHCIRAIARSNRVDQQRMLMQEAHHPDGQPIEAAEDTLDRFRTYELLLLPLEQVMQSPESHPEGDVLYHSLQVFELARHTRPYDEEFLLAALLHDVGKGIDRRNHVAAGLAALEGAISPRAEWLIEHHVEALSYHDGTLGVRLRRRLEASDDFEELMLLTECDRQGRAAGVPTPDVREALDELRRLADECGEDAPVSVAAPIERVGR